MDKKEEEVLERFREFIEVFGAYVSELKDKPSEEFRNGWTYLFNGLLFLDSKKELRYKYSDLQK